MGIADIQAAIDSIPAKKDDLRKAFEDLESYSSSFASFSLQWRDIDGHLSAIEKSIDKRFQEVKAKLALAKPAAPVLAANAKVGQDTPVIEPRPELKQLCVKMDAMGLNSYFLQNRKDNVALRREFGPALLCSPDPLALVLDSFEGFVSSSGKVESEKLASRRAYLLFLECFHGLKLEVKHSYKERASRVAKDCYDLIKNGENHHNRQITISAIRKERTNHGILSMVFLHLIVTYGLLEYFAIGDILDVLVAVASRQNIVDLCRDSVLEEKLPDLIEKLNKKGRQLDSVKFVVAFNLQHKFPPTSLFEAYIKEAGKVSHKRALEGENSAKLKDKALSEQIIAVRAVIRAVNEYNLGSLYPPGSLQNRIRLLDKERSETRKEIFENEQVSVLPKRPRSSDSSATVLPQPGPVNSPPEIVLARPPHSEKRPPQPGISPPEIVLPRPPHSENQPPQPGISPPKIVPPQPPHSENRPPQPGISPPEIVLPRPPHSKKRPPRPGLSPPEIVLPRRPHSENRPPQPGLSPPEIVLPRHPHSGNRPPQPGFSPPEILLPRLQHSESRPPWPGLVAQSPYIGLVSSFGLNVYGLGYPIGLGGSLPQPESSFLYPYGGYPSSGFPRYP